MWTEILEQLCGAINYQVERYIQGVLVSCCINAYHPALAFEELRTNKQGSGELLDAFEEISRLFGESAVDNASLKDHDVIEAVSGHEVALSSANADANGITSEESQPEDTLSSSDATECSTPLTSQDDPYEAADNKEVQHLKQELHEQKSLSGDLRRQLITRDDKLCGLREELRELKERCQQFAEESDDSYVKEAKLRKELADVKRQYALQQEKAAADARRRQQCLEQEVHRLHQERSRTLVSRTLVAPPAQNLTRALVHSPSNINTANIIAERDHGFHNAQTAFQRAQHFGGTMKTLISEQSAAPDEFNAARKSAFNVHTLNQRLEHDLHLQILEALNEHLREGVSDLQAARDHAMHQLEQANVRILQVEGYNKNLLARHVVKHAEDPKDFDVPGVCKYDELRDLRQAFAQSQHKCAELTSDNEKLHAKLAEQDQQLETLRVDKVLLSDKYAIISSKFVIWQGRIEVFMETLPGIIATEFGYEIEQVEGLQKLLDQYKSHESLTGEELRGAAEKVASTESKMIAMERQHRNEVETLTKHMKEVQQDTFRLDAEHYQLDSKLMGARAEIKTLQSQLEHEREVSAEWMWKCEELQLGRDADFVRRRQKAQLQQRDEQIEALQFTNWEQDRVIVQLEGDNWLARHWAARHMTGIRELGWERDWYRQQVDALRTRFAQSLPLVPLDIPYKPDFWDLTDEEQEQMNARHQEVIRGLTNIDMQLVPKEITQPRGIEVSEVWSKLEQEYDEIMAL